MKSLMSSLREYLEVRRALGYQLNDTERNLNKFVQFLQHLNQDHITAKLALDWAMIPQNVLRSHWSRRLCMVRLFAQYRQYDDPCTEIPPSNLLAQQACRANPHIYSDDEIYRLIVACQLLNSRGLRHHTYSTFFGLLAVTGCRVSELIALDRENFDDQQGWIVIRNSKFNKSRLLPLHQTTKLQLKKYANLRDQYHSKRASDAFFVSDLGKRLTVWSVRWAFIHVSKAIGLRAQTDTHGPRIHDLRHTFAVKSLIKWYREGANIDQKISLLSTYLGHKKPSDTYWYLSGVPELLVEAATRLENQIGE